MKVSPSKARAQFTKEFHMLTKDGDFRRRIELPLALERAKSLGVLTPELETALRKAASSAKRLPPAGAFIGTPWAAEVVSYQPGPGAGHNKQRQSVVLGPPKGVQAGIGSLDVLPLGVGGKVVVKLGKPATKYVKVFENGFTTNRRAQLAQNPEPMRVRVSTDGINWHELSGLAGQRVTRLDAVTAQIVDPGSKQAGGDLLSFDNASPPIPAGTLIRYVELTDLGKSVGPLDPSAGTAGADVAAVYGR